MNDVARLVQRLESYEVEAHRAIEQFKDRMDARYCGYAFEWSETAFNGAAMVETITEAFKHVHEGKFEELRTLLNKQVMQHCQRGNNRSTSVFANAMEHSRAYARSRVWETINDFIEYGDCI